MGHLGKPSRQRWGAIHSPDGILRLARVRSAGWRWQGRGASLGLEGPFIVHHTTFSIWWVCKCSPQKMCPREWDLIWKMRLCRLMTDLKMRSLWMSGSL